MSATNNPGWRMQLAIHRAVRRDVTRLGVALAAGCEARADAVRAYWHVAAGQLHHHHEVEDSVVWPMMSERLGDRVKALLARNSHEHRVMAASMDEFALALDATIIDPALVCRALEQMQDAIETHLAGEEADVLPLIPTAFSAEDIVRFQATDAKTTSPNVFLPWILDDAPEADLAFFTDRMPAPVRTQLESEWMPQRRMTVEALRIKHSVGCSPWTAGTGVHVAPVSLELMGKPLPKAPGERPPPDLSTNTPRKDSP